MTTEEILNIAKPGDLFPMNLDQCRLKYKELAKKYHPDADASNAAVFEHVTDLYQKALRMLKEGIWERTNFVILKTEANCTFQISYLTTFDFELGICYVCRRHVIYVLKQDKEKFYKNYIAKTGSLKYADKDMETVMKRTMPEIHKHGRLSSGEYYIVLRITEDVYPLRNLLKNVAIPGRHVAWIISRISSICCYLEYNGLVHNGINIDSCFVSPKYHSVLLLGGWWYAVKKDEKLLGTTKEIYNLMPVIAKTEKRADTTTDLESVKLLGRMLFHEKNCRVLKERNDIPAPFIDFFTRASGNDAIEEMSVWDRLLDQAYGQRKFIEFNVTEKQIYQ